MPEEFTDFISRLTNNARLSIQNADAIARGYGANEISTEHLLLGLLSQNSSTAAKIMAECGVTIQMAEAALAKDTSRPAIRNNLMTLSPSTFMALRIARDTARDLHLEHIGSEHLLHSLLRQENSRAGQLLTQLNIDIQNVLTQTESLLDDQHNSHHPANDGTATAGRQPNTKTKSILELYGTNLTNRAQQGKLDPTIGRADEVERLITILSRRTKNNPVLIGEPGVGKTAIVEGLASRIISEKVPDHLLDKEVIQLDLAAMISGTKYRGEFEDRLKKTIQEVKKRGKILLFIDELHMLVGAGAAEGALDAANILKPALARGELHMIGATTIDEYRKHIEKDTALERRFQTIIVKEPSTQETLEILQGLKGHYETHHGVEISDEVLHDAVYMADRYIADRFMPDKAIDVLDEASALVRVKQGFKPSKLREYTRELKSLNDRMEDAVTNEDYERAAMYKMRLSQINDRIEDQRLKQLSKRPAILNSDNIAHAIAVMTHIPVEKIQRSEARLLKNLERHLAKYLIGQQEAITKVAQSIRRNRSGIASSQRPIGSFVFMGPTGVGKTELARVLAREVFGSEDALIKIDMSEFSERHSASRLVGAPAGYVGYEEGGKLTDKIRRQPYSVVLFDEIEKAHKDVFNLLLQLLEDGTLTDAKGREVSFANTIVICTSNLGADIMGKESSMGFSARTKNDKQELETEHIANNERATQLLGSLMRPELINRFDAILTFRALSRKEINKIFDKLIDELQTRLQHPGIRIVVKGDAKRWLIDRGFDPKNGARPLRRTIENELEHLLAEGVIDNSYHKGDILEVSIHEDKLQLKTHQE